MKWFFVALAFALRYLIVGIAVVERLAGASYRRKQLVIELSKTRNDIAHHRGRHYECCVCEQVIESEYVSHLHDNTGATYYFCDKHAPTTREFTQPDFSVENFQKVKWRAYVELMD